MVICGRWLILMICPIWQKSQCEDPSLSQYKTVQREVPQGIVLGFFIVNISLNNLFLLVIVGQIVEFAAYSQFLRATGLSERKQMSQDLRLHSILSNQQLTVFLSVLGIWNYVFDFPKILFNTPEEKLV